MHFVYTGDLVSSSLGYFVSLAVLPFSVPIIMGLLALKLFSSQLGTAKKMASSSHPDVSGGFVFRLCVLGSTAWPSLVLVVYNKARHFAAFGRSDAHQGFARVRA